MDRRRYPLQEQRPDARRMIGTMPRSLRGPYALVLVGLLAVACGASGPNSIVRKCGDAANVVSLDIPPRAWDVAISGDTVVVVGERATPVTVSDGRVLPRSLPVAWRKNLNSPSNEEGPWRAVGLPTLPGPLDRDIEAKGVTANKGGFVVVGFEVVVGAGEVVGSGRSNTETPMIWRSTDGLTWETVWTTPILPTTRGRLEIITALRGGYVAIGTFWYDYPRTEYVLVSYWSPDGKTWEFGGPLSDVDGEPRAFGIAWLGIVGDQVVALTEVVFDDDRRLVPRQYIYTSRDGRTWERTRVVLLEGGKSSPSSLVGLTGDKSRLVAIGRQSEDLVLAEDPGRGAPAAWTPYPGSALTLPLHAKRILRLQGRQEGQPILLVSNEDGSLLTRPYIVTVLGLPFKAKC